MSAGRYVLAAGGTGGHIFPAEALARALSARGHAVALVTDARGQAFGGDLADVPVRRVSASWVRPGFVGRLRTVGALSRGYFQARGVLRQLAARLVIGFGGYPSLPTVFAAHAKHVPVLLHEQNAYAGRSNRILAKYAQRIALSFAKTEGFSEASLAISTVTGTPVREGIVAVADRAYAPPDGDDPLRLLILGGSQGARVFSDIVPEALAKLPDDQRQRLRVAQQARPEDEERARTAYAEAGIEAEIAPFFTDVPERLAACHLAITRAGASTCAELTVAGRPAILVPYPYAADDHQRFNADNLAEAGAAWVMGQDELTAEALAMRLTRLLATPKMLSGAAGAAQRFGIADAAERLADVAEKLAEDAAPLGAGGAA
jgi:UDP-N-acetylglucosamine--N-acetylmuramyl-(pentapeptide) pyrophosphoryl-undecaprenol N-acetylglucosamine transferase